MTRRVVLAALALHAVALTPLWADLRRVPEALGFSREERRTVYAFGGVPLDQVGRQLDALLPEEAPVALGERLKGFSFLEQRLGDALYPRAQDDAAAHRLELAPTAAEMPAGSVPLFNLGRAGALYLEGPVAEPRPARANGEPLPLARAVAGLLALLGPAVLVAAELRRRRLGAPLTSAVVLSALFWGLLFELATLLQLGLPRALVLGLGLGLLVVGAWRWRGSVPSSARMSRPLRVVLIAFVAIGGVRACVMPVDGWDGRSIWFMRAHQLHERGMLSLSQDVRPASFWSHYEYPLLAPAFIAAANSGLRDFSEEVGGLALTGLLLAIVSTAAALLERRGAGPLASATFAALLLLSCGALTLTGLVDGLLAALLVLALIALWTDGLAWLGVAAAMAASLTKHEGLVLGALLLVAFALALRAAGLRRRSASLFVLIPALAWTVFARASGFPHTFAGTSLASVMPEAGERLRFLASAAVGASTVFPLVLEGLAAVLLLPLLAPLRASLRPGEVRAALLMFAASLGLAFGSLFVTPLDLQFHASALDRLLLHAGAFGVTAWVLAQAGASTPAPSATR